MAVPSIYGELTAPQLAAYHAWYSALLARADHLLDCSACNAYRVGCAAGIDANDEEQRAWQAWDAARRAEDAP